MAFNLKSITSTRRPAARKGVLYGPGKIGKSTTAASLENVVGILTEDGCANIDAQAFDMCQSLSDVYECIGTLLNEDHPFQNVFLDSIDWLEPLLYAHICQQHGWKDIEAPGYGKGYIAAAEEWRTVLAGFDELRYVRNMGVVLLAHEQIKRFENPMTESYDHYTLKLHQKATALIQEWADVIAFANYRTFTRKEDAGFNKKETKAIGSGERLLYLEARPAFLAGNRFGLPAEMPLNSESFKILMTPTVPMQF